MTFLPIVGRELRVASRRKATYWTRVIAAGFWILITGCFLIIQSVSKGSFGSMMTGHWLFLILSWLAFFYTSLCGLFLTSDTLSEEKREGTLGLLFLTDLRGFDIVLGKLAGTSLQAAYSLLAVFPIFAIPFLLGGVSGELFGKMLLLLINSLFLSLAIGIFVSSLSHDSQKAINGTLFLLAAVLGLPLLIDWFRAGWDDTRFSPFLALASPILSFSESMQNRFGYFWNNMAVAHSIAWLLLIAASICAPRTWQQKESAKVKKILFARFRPGAATQLKHLRTRLLEINPAFWLSAREQSQSFYFKLILLLASLVLGLIYCSGQKVTIEGLAGFAGGLGGFLSFLLLIWVAAQASRFLVEAKRTGALELLLCSPLSSRQIVQGHWRALCHGFAFPIALTIGIQLSALVLQWVNMAGTLNSSINGMEWSAYTAIQAVSTVIEPLFTAAALAWFGMWMGLTTSKASTAVIKTFVFVVVIPTVALGIAQISIQMTISFTFLSKASASSAKWIAMLQPIIALLLSVAANVVFIVLARRKLFPHFRELAAGETIRRIRRSDLTQNAPPIVQPK